MRALTLIVPLLVTSKSRPLLIAATEAEIKTSTIIPAALTPRRRPSRQCLKPVVLQVPIISTAPGMKKKPPTLGLESMVISTYETNAKVVSGEMNILGTSVSMVL
ncbi:MAG: hypothetical protein CFH02_01598 [Alphaproteobacteria bacterium MarineAlpha3_Bin1]|nr:MAG: hypothetical protein CFH02_01598 [Alphaproteobacteria bacterium MarineAlpha3_Bin1]